MKHIKSEISENITLGEFEGYVNVQLTAREFELLAQAYDYWALLVAPLRSGNSRVADTTKLLRQFWLQYKALPF